MKYRSIPNTTLEVSPICLGTMTFGTPVAEPEAIEITHFAIDNGINFLDTADIYEGYTRVIGSPGGVSEEMLGKALAGRRDKVVLATKVCNAVGPGPDDVGLGRKHIMRGIENSLARLRTDFVDIYYFHRPDPDTPIEESIAAFNELIDAGKVRHYGFSNYDAAGIEAILRACDDAGLRRPVITQPPYSLLKRDIEQDVLPLCHKEQIAVVPYQVLQGGLLTGKYRRGQAAPPGSRLSEKKEWVGDVSGETFDTLEGIERDAEVAGLTMTQYAITWTLKQPGITSAIIGVKRPQQVADAIEAAERL